MKSVPTDLSVGERPGNGALVPRALPWAGLLRPFGAWSKTINTNPRALPWADLFWPLRGGY
jgi:hypothetical protein